MRLRPILVCKSSHTHSFSPPLPLTARIHASTHPRIHSSACCLAPDDNDSYYDSALSSVYLWDLDAEPSAFAGSAGSSQAPSTFAGVVLFKKSIGEADGDGTHGTWDSLHVFEASERPGASNAGSSASAGYKLTSTVMLGLTRQEDGTEASDKIGSLEIAGSLTRQSEADYPLPDFVSHISNIGKMIEDMETKMRNQLQVRLRLTFPPPLPSLYTR